MTLPEPVTPPISATPEPAVAARPRRWPWILGAVAALTGVALVSLGGALAVRSMVTEATDATTCPNADGRTSELRRCLQPVVAFVETPSGTGTGVLLDSGFLITNAHVVDPWEELTVTLDGVTHDDVEVVGVDAFADIALIGPIPGAASGIVLAPLPPLEDDEPEVFLVGYPGGVEGDDPAVAISNGVVSRVRSDEATGLTYVQTDAAIAGGQSGGALVDANGRVLGISGLGFAEEFALALGTDDVIVAIERIRSGDGDERRTVPRDGDGLSLATSVTLTPGASTVTAVMPPGEERTVELVVDGGGDEAIMVDVGTPMEWIGSNAAYVDSLVDDGVIDEDMAADEPLLDEPSPGTYRFEVPADEPVYISISSDSESAEVQVESDSPFVLHSPTTEGARLSVGSTERGVLDSFAWESTHELDVTEVGDLVVTVSAGASDAYVTVVPPGEEYDPTDTEVSSDDDGGGLYGLDAEYEFTVEADQVGTWRVVVGTWDGVLTGYVVTVREP